MTSDGWTTITVPTRPVPPFGVIDVRAFETSTVGLVAVPPDAIPGVDADYWALVHVRSGCAVSSFPDPESAQRAAAALAGFDFTADVFALREHEAEILAVVDRCGGHKSQRPRAPADVVEAMERGRECVK